MPTPGSWSLKIRLSVSAPGTAAIQAGWTIQPRALTPATQCQSPQVTPDVSKRKTKGRSSAGILEDIAIARPKSYSISRLRPSVSLRGLRHWNMEMLPLGQCQTDQLAKCTLSPPCFEPQAAMLMKNPVTATSCRPQARAAPSYQHKEEKESPGTSESREARPRQDGDDGGDSRCPTGSWRLLKSSSLSPGFKMERSVGSFSQPSLTSRKDLARYS
ncbi:hypothetical protein VTK56DRAFT_7271 [Thermocarpiscus australiensis]